MYIVVDWYDGFEVLGETNSMIQAVILKDDRIEDTDGECDVCIFDTTNPEHVAFLKKVGYNP